MRLRLRTAGDAPGLFAFVLHDGYDFFGFRYQQLQLQFQFQFLRIATWAAQLPDSGADHLDSAAET